LNFNGTISGNVYAQPLYIEGGPSGRARVIVVTESNNVFALDAITGTVIWQRNVGAPVTSGLPCGNISPLGITGTPVVHFASRSLFFDAMINGPTKKHFIFSLNVDTGAINPGPNALPLTTASLDPDTWQVHLEARGIVIEGKLENIGSAHRVFSGTWTQAGQKGDFRLIRN